MIASEQEYCFRIVELDRKDEQYTLHRKHTSVYIVSQEEVLCVCRISSNVKKFLKIVELAVNVSDHCHRVSQLHEVWFFAKHSNGVV